MRLILAANIGTADALRFGLAKTHEGDPVDVAPNVAAVLLRRGWATEAPAEVPEADSEPEAQAAADPAAEVPGRPRNIRRNG